MQKTIGRCVLFMHTDTETPRNGEGTFLRLKNGNILFAYSCFSGETWYDDCTADIAGIISADEGETWTSKRILLKHDDDARNLMCPSLLRLPDGRIGLIYLRKSKNNINAVPFIAYSDDEGETFSSPVKIIDDDNNYFVIENDHAVVLRNGRIILPVNLHSDIINDTYEIIEHGKKCIFASDDNGKTWSEITVRQDIPFSNISETGLQETCVYEQNDGILRAFSRTDMAFQYECFSEDNGKTWTVPEPNRFFSSPDSPLLMKRAGIYTLAVFNPTPNYTTRDCENSWGRTPLVCAVSKDDGKTFSLIHFLETDPENGYCYPAIFDGGNYVLISYYHSDNSGTPLTATKIIKITYDELEDWDVYFTSGFYGSKKGKKGEKITVDKSFCWAEKEWIIPAVYSCPKGIVIDICEKTDSSVFKKFKEKWSFCGYNENMLTDEQKTEFADDIPTPTDFRCQLRVNGKLCLSFFGSSITYIPQEYLPDGDESNRDAIKTMNYYNLDKANAWTVHRISIPWATAKKPVIKSAELELIADMKTVKGDKFTTPETGEKIEFINPLNGNSHILEVKDIRKNETAFSVEGYDFPDKNTVISFSVTPDIDKKYFSVRDTEQNDAPIPTGEKLTGNEASSIAIIGGADGPTAFFVAEKQNNTELHTASSALKRGYKEKINWQFIFRFKPDENISFTLI